MWNNETANTLNIITVPEFGTIITKYAKNSGYKERVMDLTWQQFVILYRMMGEMIEQSSAEEAGKKIGS